MPASTWKGFEWRIAKRYHTERNSKTALGSVVADVIAALPLAEKVVFAMECKLRSRIPVFLQQVLEQIETAAGDGQVPIAIVKEKYKKDNDSYVFMKLEDFDRLVNFEALEAEGN